MSDLGGKEYYSIPVYARPVAEAKRDSLCRWMAHEKISPARIRDFEATMMGGVAGAGRFLDCTDPLGDVGFALLKAGNLGWRRVARAGVVVEAFRKAAEVEDGVSRADNGEVRETA